MNNIGNVYSMSINEYSFNKCLRSCFQTNIEDLVKDKV